MKLNEKEQIRFNIKANLKKGIEYVSGNLAITNENVYFKPHVQYVQKEELIVPLKTVKHINKANIMGVVPNGMVIELHNGSNYKFVLTFMDDERIKIINYIDSMIA